MANIAQPDFKNRLLALLKETFEGPSGSESAYLAEGTGLLQTLDSLNAEAASRAHTAYHLGAIRHEVTVRSIC
jgi:hypothetical protein